MTSALLIIAVASALASAVLLALSQERNWRIASGPGAGRRTTMRQIGWPLTMLTLTLCIVRDGASFGTILGLFFLAVAFVGVTLTLAFRPRWLRPATLPFATDSH